MATKLFIKLQTPTIELKLTAKDSSGVSDSFFAGFKRYDLDDAQKKIEQLEAVFSSAKETASLNQKELNSFIKNEVIYLKGITLELANEDGSFKNYPIADTRTAKPYEGLWESPEECLAVLLDMYLSSAPYRLSFITALNKALFNAEYSDGEAKN